MLSLEQLHSRLLFQRPAKAQNQFSNSSSLIKSAVLLPIYPSKQGLNVLMIQRAAHLRHHPKQIAFVGGKHEASDSSLLETAIRESHEEIGLNSKYIQPICHLTDTQTLTGFNITPFVAFLKHKPKLLIDKNEVEKVLHLKLDDLLNDEYYSQSQHLRGNKQHTLTWIHLKNQVIWGASAQIIKQLKWVIN